MHKSPSLLSALLFPAISLVLLFFWSRLPPQPVAPEAAEVGSAQKRPAFMNKTSLLLLRRNYSIYKTDRKNRAEARLDAALYNQCVKASDPSVLQGTDLPSHL